MYTVTMVKPLFLFWLIVSTLGYGSVWAFDDHVDELDEHQNVAGDLGHSPDGDGDNLSCDHCCHASAHTVAFSPFQSRMDYSGTCTGFTPYRYTLSFLAIAPPDRPPQS
jgi:hypothetical protein